MSLRFQDLPRDDNGGIVGKYRVRIDGVPREDLEHRPIESGELMRLHAAVGSAALLLEPWDPPAPAFEAPRRRTKRR